MNIYESKVVRWIDGDTVELDVDLGFRLRYRDHFRLQGIDTPERGKVGYLEARMRAAQLAPPGSLVIASTYKGDKYGRWLTDIHMDTETLVNQRLIDEGFAQPYFGGTK